MLRIISNRTIYGQLVLLTLISFASHFAVAQDRLPQSMKIDENCYRGEGTTFEILLSGQVTEDDTPINEDLDVEVMLRWNDKIFWTRRVRTENSKYQVWVPVGAHPFYSIQVSGGNSTGAAGRTWVTLGNLREAMRDGLDLKLSKPNRFIKLRTTYLGKTLPNTKVFVRGDRTETIFTTNLNGEVSVGLQPDSSSLQLIAWSESKKISPNIYIGQGDPRLEGSELTIELVECISKSFVVLSNEDDPIANVGVRLFGRNENERFDPPPTMELRTDEQGRVSYDWFPNDPKLKMGFHLDSKVWLPGKNDQTFEGDKLLARKSKVRRSIKGKIESTEVQVAGLAVKCDSFQSQLENAVESAYAIVDPKGNFTMDLLPGSTYAAFIQDSRIVSEHQKVVFAADQAELPEIQLTAMMGQPIPILVTEGKKQVPLKNARVSVSSTFDVSWVEHGSPRTGSLSRHVQGFTNSIGECILYAPPGEARVSVSFGDWHANSTNLIAQDRTDQITFHRDREIEFRGKVAISGEPSPLENCHVYLASIDGKTRENQLLKTDIDGCFSGKTDATALGGLAITADQKFMGSFIATNLKEDIAITLESPMSLRGKVVASDNRPIVNRIIEARVTWKQMPNSAGTLKLNCIATTDSDGRYELSRLPCKVPLEILLLQDDGSAIESVLDEVFFENSSDSRPELLSVLNAVDDKQNQTVEERFQSRLKSCQINNYRLIVAIAKERSEFDEFLNMRLLDPAETPEIDGCMLMILRPDQLKQEPTLRFAKQKDWPQVKDREAFICIYDGEGMELGRWHQRELKQSDFEIARTLLKSHVPPKSDARAKWSDAFRIAKESNRRVWVIIGGRYCNPCFLLNAWIEKHREVLASEFVFLKIDVNNSINYKEICASLEQGRMVGIPFHGIFAADGALLQDSYGPLGNIGFPSGLESRRHLKKMLEAGCIRLTSSEIEELLRSLE